MKISYNWIKEYLDLDVSPVDLAEKIERTSVEVDGVTTPSDGLKKIVVGHVLSLEAHPDSDHLHICQVDVGEDEPYRLFVGRRTLPRVRTSSWPYQAHGLPTTLRSRSPRCGESHLRE